MSGICFHSIFRVFVLPDPCTPIGGLFCCDRPTPLLSLSLDRERAHTHTDDEAGV